MKRLQHGVAVLAAVLLVACDKPDEQPELISKAKQSDQLVVPKNDSKAYKTLTLKNGLRVLLVQDHQASKAAASLNVDVGSGSDPRGREGLAHFLEHMLFLGTDKYPDAGEYQQFISSQGGQHNAYTAFADTNYFFDVNAEAFEPALDRFARFFVAPLFDEKYLERERHAVHSEFSARKDNELRRYLDVVKTVINPAHPFSKFTVGNLDTLKVEGLAEDVIALYKEHYRAGNMSLVLVGPAPIAQQQAWVESKFAGIPSGGPVEMAIAEPLFNVGQLPAIINVKPLKTQRSLSLSFPTPNVYPYRLQKPLLLLGHLLGHEGEGSLFQYLRKNGWAESLSAGNFFGANGEGLFTVSITLTEAGFSKADDVVEAVFTSLQLIQAGGVEAWRYQELADIAQLQFDYQSQTQVLSLARRLASSMDDYPQQHWLDGDFRMDGFDQPLFKQLLASFTPKNLLLSISGPEADVKAKSPWYDTEYSLLKPNAEQQNRWRKPSSIGELKLPTKNKFIPSNLVADVEALEKPIALRSEPGFKVWYQPVNKFNEPKASVRLQLQSSKSVTSPQQRVVYSIAAKMLNDAANLKAYDAKSMGYQLAVTGGSHGLDLRTFGFDQKLAELVSLGLTVLKDIHWTEAQYERTKTELLRRWQNAEKEAPYRVLASAHYADAINPAWGSDVLAAAAEQLSFDQFLSLWQAQSNFDYVTALVVGSVDKVEVEGLLGAIDRFKPRGKSASLKPRIQVLPVEKASQLAVTVQQQDNAVLAYMQAPILGIEGRALSALTANIYEAEFYSDLRTEQQLGYIVYFSNRLLHKTPGMMAVVQSPAAAPQQIIDAMELFWQQRLSSETVTKAQFEQYKQSLRQSLLKPEKNLAELASRRWRDISLEYDNFDQIDQLVAALDGISFEQWQSFAAQVFAKDFSGRRYYVTEHKS